MVCLSFLMAMCSPSLFGVRYTMGRSSAMGCNPTADYWWHFPKTDPAPQSRGRHDTKKAVVKRPRLWIFTAPRSQVLMIFRPAGRFLTIPFPPRPFAARFFAAVILPPLLFFAIRNPFCCVLMFIVAQHIARRVGPCLLGVTLPGIS